jgi:hypothetical protein
VPAISQRRALGGLFLLLTLAFAGIAVAAVDAGVWVIALAAAVLAGWLAGLAFGSLRKPRGRG